MKSGIVVLLALTLAIVPTKTVSQGQDLTLQEGTSGSIVVAAAVARTQQSGVFTSDNELLRRIAYAETSDGTDSDTYRVDYHGGIWAVDQILFQDTQDVISHSGLGALFQQINSTLAIDWTIAEWNDLRKPLYSALACRIYLHNVPEAIPLVNNVQSQAEYWQRNYNTAGSVTAFVTAVNELDSMEGMR